MQSEQLMKNKERKGQEHGGVIENNEKNYPPTGEWSQVKPEISDKCIACGQCVKFCPEDAMRIKEVDGKNKSVVDFRYCKGCGLCAEICPVQAITMINKNEGRK